MPPPTPPTPTSRRGGPLLVPLLVVLLVGLVACGSDGGSEGGSGDGPVARPTGSPFTVRISGPTTAVPGESVTATLTNAGRPPDGYLLVSDPVGAVSRSSARPQGRTSSMRGVRAGSGRAS